MTPHQFQTAPANRPKLSGVTVDVLAPVWARREITIEKMAATLGVWPQSLERHAKKLGLPKRRESRITGREDQFAAMWQAGVTRAEMCSFFGIVKRANITRHAQRLGLPKRPKGGGQHLITLSQYYEQRMGAEYALVRAGEVRA